MRESAVQAGIPSDKLLIALEPEAASVYSQFQEIDKSADKGYDIASPGTQYLVADVGGGTTDITIHEKLKNGKLRELNKASGEGCGGRSVDEYFFRDLDDKFGKQLMQSLKNEKPKRYLDIHRNFEDVKKTIGLSTPGEKSIKLPIQTMNDLLKDCKKTVAELAESKSFKLKDGKLIISTSDFKKMFDPTIKKIIIKIQEALQFENSDNVSIIMLVGGFAKSELLQSAVQTHFPNKRLIVPEDANLAVLKGAVLYGHDPETIDPRVTRFTYGIEMGSPFRHGIHEPSRMYFDEFGNTFCKKSFSVIIKGNETVKLGTRIKRTYCIPPFSTEINLDFYCAENIIPLYTDERECRKIGTLTVTIPKPSDERREIDVHYIFGNTEIKVEAVESKYKREALAMIEYE